MLPEDEHNRLLLDNTHPSNQVNPEPAEMYNLVVIGAGTAGLVTAAGAAGLGARTALIEHNLMGGDCLNYGCVPSKSIIASARVAAKIRGAHRYGVKAGPEPEVDFPAVMERMRRLRASISFHDSVKRFTDLGVDVFLGRASFQGPNTVSVGEAVLKFRKAVIATGARPVAPNIPGLKEAGFLTNETLFSITELPKRLAIMGAGPIGCEMAQAFQRLGAKVFLIHKNARIMDREDKEAAAIVQRRFVSEGVQLFLNSEVKSVEKQGQEKNIRLTSGGAEVSVTVDEIVVGVGRAPNTEGLNLEGAGVSCDRSGVVVNDNLQTANPNIYAAGDVCMKYKFTHAADAAARIVIQNALFRGKKKLSALTLPWCTYTDPEIAHVGVYERGDGKDAIPMDTYRRDFKDVDRAVTDGDDEGFIKVHVKKGTDKILGATIVGPNAGDLIGEIATAMVGNLGLKNLSQVIHPYPTHGEIIKQVADMYNRTRLTPAIRRIFDYWLSWNR